MAMIAAYRAKKMTQHTGGAYVRYGVNAQCVRSGSTKLFYEGVGVCTSLSLFEVILIATCLEDDFIVASLAAGRRGRSGLRWEGFSE